MLTSTIVSDAHAVCQITACGSKSKGPATVSGAAKPRIRVAAATGPYRARGLRLSPKSFGNWY